MTSYLLDVNVLIALLDAGHVHHDPAHAWFAKHARRAWATCPITENGVLRVIGNPRYPNSPGSPAAVVPLLTGLREISGHEFWPDDISLLEGERCDATRLLSVGSLTDIYLLALAKAHGGQLATFDRRLVTNAVHGGPKHLQLIV